MESNLLILNNLGRLACCAVPSLMSGIIVEVLFPVRADGAELVGSVLLQDAGVDQVAQEDRSVLADLRIHLHLLKLVFKLLAPGELGVDGRLLLLLGLLLLLDLLLRAFSLAAVLHHVRADAVLHYKELQNNELGQ